MASQQDMQQFIKIAAGLAVFAFILKYVLDAKEGYAPYPNSVGLTSQIPPATTLTPSSDLLPKPVAGWNDNFRPQNLSNMNFVDAVKLQGYDTKGSSMKNANRDLRPSIPIPKKTGEWYNSSIDPDIMRRPLY